MKGSDGMRDYSLSALPERYAAPALQYPVRRSARLLAIVLIWTCLVLGALGCAIGQMSSDPQSLWRLFALWALTAMALCFCVLNARWWLKMPCGCLQWDQKKWGFRPLSLIKMSPYDGLMNLTCVELDSPEVLFDLQWAVVLAVKVHGSSRKTFLWLERSQAPTVWLDLRRALSFS